MISGPVRYKYTASLFHKKSKPLPNRALRFSSPTKTEKEKQEQAKKERREKIKEKEKRKEKGMGRGGGGLLAGLSEE